VLRNQSTTTETARYVVERLQAVGGRVRGAVINGINIRDPDYAGYRRYYSSYYATQNDPKQTG